MKLVIGTCDTEPNRENGASAPGENRGVSSDSGHPGAELSGCVKTSVEQSSRASITVDTHVVLELSHTDHSCCSKQAKVVHLCKLTVIKRGLVSLLQTHDRSVIQQSQKQPD